MTDTVADATKDLAQDVTTEAKKAVGEQTLFEQAQEAVTDAFEATIEAVKEHPLAAAGIAAGAAAAVAGAVFGATKLFGDDQTATKK